jgi:hypothetical protein
MSDILNLSENLNNREVLLLDELRQYPIKVNEGVWVLSESPKNLVENVTDNINTRIFKALSSLEEKGLAEQKNNEIHISPLGIKVTEYLQSLQVKTTTSKLQNLRHAKLDKSNEMLVLYRQGLSYQDIGDRYKLSRERVRQLLDFNPAFHTYLIEREAAEVQAEKDQQEKKRQEQLAKSIITVYPERVAELWDYEKNGDLNPENIVAGTTLLSIWFKCPNDGHSWKKTPDGITSSWDKGSSGCPKCAGKSKKPEKQPAIIEVYPELISQYWDYEQNNELNIDPSVVTLSSNKKVWFRCPQDGNIWQSSIASTVNQQWSRGNAGCRVCNGTDKRKRGEWLRKKEPIASEFPNEVNRYWFHQVNDELKLDPMKLTSGSSKEAFFKCPIDGHEWISTLASITRSAWKNGNSGCPVCRGLVSSETTSLSSLYPDYIRQYWDYKKNNAFGILPEKVTRGSQKEAWFKCPIDGYEWRTRIGSITSSAWSCGNSVQDGLWKLLDNL